MNFLVVGGTGTISYGIVIEALNRGHHVTIINRGNRKYRCPEGAELVTADITKTEETKEKLNNCFFDIIIDPLVYDLNSLKRDIELFRDHCRKYVYISSCCAFGTGKGIIDESHEMKPVSKYGKNKLLCENYLRNNSFPFKYTIIRPYITYGDIRIPIPFACRQNPYTIIERVKKGQPLVCFNYTTHKTFHNLMDIRDFSRITVSLLEKPVSDNNDYNICSKNTYTWEEAYRCLYDCINQEPHIYQINRKHFKYLDYHLYEDIIFDKDQDGTIYSGEKALDQSGEQREEYPLAEGMQNLVGYMENNLAGVDIQKKYNYNTDMLLVNTVRKKDKYLKEYLQTMGLRYQIKLRLSWAKKHLGYYKKRMISKARKN